MSRRAPRSRNVLRIARFLTVLVAVTAVVVGTVAPVEVATASASQSTTVNLSRASVDSTQQNIVKSSLAGFKPGNIISDAVFTNKNTMTEAQIQSFFNSKVKTCRAGYTCLKDFKISSVTRPADSYCKGYKGASSESAARIIYRVAQACNINPQVLIVMLQKEQGLVNHTWPSQWRYDIALGQGCPDTAACDPKYVGFFHQIYGAARQMQTYLEGKYFTWYAPGKTWNLRYHPNASCGSSPVYIANKATAALYYYTPYQPNAAALAAGYGEAKNACSSYGNRNFYNYFTDWFGSTQTGKPTKPTTYPVTGAIAAEWKAQGGATGRFGAATSAAVFVSANGGGYVQQFAKGTIWKSKSSSKAYSMGTGVYRANYVAGGGEKGKWGWPTGPAVCHLAAAGCKMPFQKGTGYYSAASGSVLVPTKFDALYVKLRAESSRFGYPIKPAIAGPNNGFEQDFQGGVIAYSPATRLVQVSGGFLDVWRSEGGVASRFGYPATAVRPISANGGGTVQQFTKGQLWTSAAGTFGMSSGAYLKNYRAVGAESGAWGWPTGNADCRLAGGGCVMAFQKGTVAWSAGTGSVLMSKKAAAEWLRYGGPGRLGYPVSGAKAVSQNGGGRVQTFTRGTLFEAGGGAFGIGSGVFLRNYLAAGGPQGSAWGWPTSTVDCTLTGGGCVMAFQKGSVAWSAGTGSVLMSKNAAAEWLRYGGPGRLGYPISNAKAVSQNGGGRVQAFTRGTLFEAGGGAFGIGSGVFLRNYLAAGGPQGSAWGWPTSTVDCTVSGGGCVMSFRKGLVAYSAATGSQLIPNGPILDEWRRRGGLKSPLGYPASGLRTSGTYISLTFQNGTLVYNTATKQFTVK